MRLANRSLSTAPRRPPQPQHGSPAGHSTGGQSPSNAAPADDDEDGIPDGYELALVGNTPELGPASSKSLGVSFNSNRDNDVAAMDSATVAGVVPSTGWVSTDGGADAAGGANGSISNGYSVNWSSNGTWNTNNGGADGDDKLMNGYIDAIGGGGAAKVEISGISAAFEDGYDLYVYFGSDGNNRTGKVALTDGATYSFNTCLLYTSPSPRDGLLSRMPSSA